MLDNQFIVFFISLLQLLPREDPVQLSSVDIIAPFYQNKFLAQKNNFDLGPVFLGRSVCSKIQVCHDLN